MSNEAVSYKQTDCVALQTSYRAGARSKDDAFRAMGAAQRERDRLKAQLAEMERRSRGLSQLVRDAEREQAPEPYDRFGRGGRRIGGRGVSMRVAVAAQRFVLGVVGLITVESLKAKWREYEAQTRDLRSAARAAENRFQAASHEARRQQRELSDTARALREAGRRVPPV